MPIFLWSVVVSQSTMAERREGSGWRTSSRTSVTATRCSPSFHDERTVHLARMHIALEVVRPRLQRVHVVGLGGHAVEEVGRIRGPAQAGPALQRILGEDLHVVRHAGVLVV